MDGYEKITHLPNFPITKCHQWFIPSWWCSAPGLFSIWRSTDHIWSRFFSQGYMWTIHPKTWGTKAPPAASHSSWVEIEPARPNLGFLESISISRPLGGLHMFTCWCHCAMLRG